MSDLSRLRSGPRGSSVNVDDRFSRNIAGATTALESSPVAPMAPLARRAQLVLAARWILAQMDKDHVPDPVIDPVLDEHGRQALAVGYQDEVEVIGTLPATVPIARGAGEIVTLSWVPEGEIPRAHRRFVRRHIDSLANQHRLGRVHLRWFRPAADQSMIVALDDEAMVVCGVAGTGDFWCIALGAGWVGPVGVRVDDRPNTIALEADLRGDAAVVQVVAHEIKHLLQHRDGEEGDELEADLFGLAYLDRVTGNVA